MQTLSREDDYEIGVARERIKQLIAEKREWYKEREWHGNYWTTKDDYYQRLIRHYQKYILDEQEIEKREISSQIREAKYQENLQRDKEIKYKLEKEKQERLQLERVKLKAKRGRRRKR